MFFIFREFLVFDEIFSYWWKLKFDSVRAFIVWRLRLTAMHVIPKTIASIMTKLITHIITVNEIFPAKYRLNDFLLMISIENIQVFDQKFNFLTFFRDFWPLVTFRDLGINFFEKFRSRGPFWYIIFILSI